MEIHQNAYLMICALFRMLLYFNKKLIKKPIYPQGQQIFLKGHIVNILDFASSMVSVTTTQLCNCSVKTNGCDCVSIKLYLQKQAGKSFVDPDISPLVHF